LRDIPEEKRRLAAALRAGTIAERDRLAAFVLDEATAFAANPFPSTTAGAARQRHAAPIWRRPGHRDPARRFLRHPDPVLGRRERGHARVDQVGAVDGLQARAREDARDGADLGSQAMTGGEAYRAKLPTDDAIDAAISAYLADPSAPAVIEIEKGRIDVATAVLAHTYAVEVLAREGVTGPQRRNAVRTAVLLAPVG
jgi:hypothetical protein